MVLSYLPSFENASDGLLPVVVNDLSETKVEFYITSNGGDVWAPLANENVDRDVRQGKIFPIDVIDTSEWILPTTEYLPNLSIYLIFMDFISEGVGWALTANSVCTSHGEQGLGEGIIECAIESQLLGTHDGGETWSENLLPAYEVFLPLIAK